MMRDALLMWKDLEEETGQELLVEKTVLVVGSDKSQDYRESLEVNSDDIKVMSSMEIMKKYPAIKNLPSNFTGFENGLGGIVNARKTLESTRKLLEEKYNVPLLFNTKVVKASKNSVETSDGTVYTADNVVVAAGAYTLEDFDTESTAKRYEVEYYSFKGNEGLPGGYMEHNDENDEYYGLLDGDNLEHWKLGVFDNRKFMPMIEYLQERFPEQLEKIRYTHP
mmetsp:Transcript_20786/g.23128  ORF Transcript_20786/g.23128 Transcript_20786/m.23128 type:complete len:223 (+) Transcript_20786:176-844(+)